jgi:hypothetical protein
MRVQICAVAVLLAACSPPAQTKTDAPAAAEIDPAIATVVTAAMPGVEIVSAEADGEGEYEVTGTFGGQEYEFDLMGPDGGWRVVEIQRDIVWTDAPDAVRTAATAAPDAFEPVRVIESRQPVDNSVVYELFKAGVTAAPSMEVRFMDGEAAVMPPAH